MGRQGPGGAPQQRFSPQARTARAYTKTHAPGAMPAKLAVKTAMQREKALDRARTARAKQWENISQGHARWALQRQALRDERARNRELNQRYEHLVPFDGLRRDLRLQARAWGINFRELVAILAAAKMLLATGALAVVIMSLPLFLPAVRQAIGAIFWSISCLIGLCLRWFRAMVVLYTISCAHVLVRPLWMYLRFFRQRRRLRGTMDICSVCLDEFAANNFNGMKTLACGHCFHANCIDPWLRQRSFCPLCRTH